LDVVPLKSVIVPPNPGGFSALGLLSSDRVYSETRTFLAVIDAGQAGRITKSLDELERDLLAQAGVAREQAQVVRSVDARLLGQGSEIPFIPVPSNDLTPSDVDGIIASFHAEYQRRNAIRFEEFSVEAVALRVQVIVASDKVQFARLERRATGTRLQRRAVQELRYLYPEPVLADCYERADLRSGDEISGPAVVWEENSTTFIPAEHIALVGDFGEITVT
jgi:N-methylhydantoinase A